MSDFSLDSSSLIGALKAQIATTVSELDGVIAKLEEMKRDLADPVTEAQHLATKRFKHDAHLRQLSEKSETAKKALDKLMLQTVEQEQYHGRILATIEVLRKQKISLRADPSVGPSSLNVKVRDIGGIFPRGIRVRSLSDEQDICHC